MSNYIDLILKGILVPVLPLLTVYLISLLKKKTEDIKTKTNNNTINKYIDIAENAIETAVISVTQTIVDTAKKNNTWTKELALEAFNKARDKALIIMGTTTEEILSGVYGDFNTWLENKIEYYVNQTK